MSDKLHFHDAEREGILTRNPLFSSGVIIAPAAAAVTDIYTGIVLALVFSIVTFVTVTLCSFVPRKLVYTIRIILYTLVASLVYVPVHIMFLNGIFGPSMDAAFSAVGIYSPLFITNSLITLRTETKFYRLSRPYMLRLAGFYVIGYDLAIIVFGTIRGILTTGVIFGVKLLPFSLPALSTLFGGFILLALMSAGFRWFLQLVSEPKSSSKARKVAAKKKGDTK